jgi:hypothetical protein
MNLSEKLWNSKRLLEIEIGFLAKKVELKIDKSSQRVYFGLVREILAAKMPNKFNARSLRWYFKDLTKFCKYKGSHYQISVCLVDINQ